jgi:anaerobic magnesium-protoporphyrin IX monomethyl ester cyclase
MNAMRTDIVLIQPPGWAVQTPPMGLALLKSALNSKGITNKIIDLNVEIYSIKQNIYKDSWELANGYYIWERESYVKEFFDYFADPIRNFLYTLATLQPKCVGLSAHCSTLVSARLLASKIKQILPETKVILGGPEVARFTNDWEVMLEKYGVDAVVFGEGEETLPEIIKYYSMGAHAGKIVGAAYKDASGNIVQGDDRQLIKDLNSQPFADFTDFNLDLYVSRNVLPTYFSRGCINYCVFCTERNYFPKFRNRSGKRVYDELVYQLKKHPNTTYFRMHDSVSNGNMRELEDFCDRMIDGPLPVNFNLENAVIRKEMDKRMYSKLKRAGCTLLGYGLESPSKTLLSAVGKKACLDADFDKVVREGAKAKLIMGINMMFGLPGETPEDFQMQLDFLRKNKKYRKMIMINPALNFCYFPKGSLVYSNPGQYHVDMELGELFWSEEGGKNTFPERLEKFERFCKMAAKYGYINLFNIQQVLNKNEMLGNYFLARKELQKSLDYLKTSYQKEVRTLTLAKNIVRLYDMLKIPPDDFYRQTSEYAHINSAQAELWFDRIHDQNDLRNAVLERSLLSNLVFLKNILPKRQPAVLRFSFSGIKGFIKQSLLNFLLNNDKTIRVIEEIVQSVQNKFDALKKQ